MAQATPFLLVLCLALAAPGLSVEKCNLTGEWISDGGETMTIWLVDEEGKFEGTYGTLPPSVLEGVQRHTDQNNETIFGFFFYQSFTADSRVFTGQCFIDKTGNEVLKTIWLLRSGRENGRPTMVGTSDFTRLYWQRQGGITGNCKADRSARDTKPIFCSTTCF